MIHDNERVFKLNSIPMKGYNIETSYWIPVIWLAASSCGIDHSSHLLLQMYIF